MRTLKHQRIPDCIEIDPVSVVEASVYDKDMRLKHAALDDAQATIAALQDTIIQMGGQAAVLAKDAMAAKEQVAALQAERDEYKTMYACLTGETYDNPIADLKAQLTQRTAECDALKLVNDMHMKTVMKLSHIVEQRTAELEAAKAERDEIIQASVKEPIHEPVTYQALAGARSVAKLAYGELIKMTKRRDDLQAELEHVRGERDHAKKMEAVQKEVADNQTWHVQKLRTLIAALPKVEGEIQATRIPCAAAIGEWWYVGWIRFPNERTAQSYVDLLRHRQGMGG